MYLSLRSHPDAYLSPNQLSPSGSTCFHMNKEEVGAGATVGGRIMPTLSPIRVEVLSPVDFGYEKMCPPAPFPCATSSSPFLLCCFPLITDLLAVEVYQAHKSKQDRGPDRGRDLYTGRALILSGLVNNLQFRQLLVFNIHVCRAHR